MPDNSTSTTVTDGPLVIPYLKHVGSTQFDKQLRPTKLTHKMASFRRFAATNDALLACNYAVTYLALQKVIYEI